MPYADWIGYDSEGDGQFLLEPIDPILDTGSGKLNLPTGGNANWAPDPGGAYGHGKTKLRYETLCEVSISAIGTANARMGIAWMQSADDVTGTGKSFYFFGIENNGSNFVNNPRYVLYKTTDGWGDLVALATPVAFITAIGIQSLRVDSIYDARLGGNWIRCYAGQTDFNAMTQQFNVIDFSSPLISSVNEGLGVDADSTGSQLQIFFDETSLYNITVTP